jgi:hypothetical protein
MTGTICGGILAQTNSFTRIGKTNLVDEDTNHITFGTLQGSERTTEEEKHVVLLAFHADTQKYTSVCVEIEPKVMGEEVAKALRVKTDVRAADGIVLADERAIADADHQPKRALDGKIVGFIPCMSFSLIRGVEGKAATYIAD